MVEHSKSFLNHMSENCSCGGRLLGRGGVEKEGEERGKEIGRRRGREEVKGST